MDIREGFLSEKNGWMSGVATQAGKQLKCLGAKGAVREGERISERKKIRWWKDEEWWRMKMIIWWRNVVEVPRTRWSLATTPKNVVAQIVQGPWKQLKAGAITLILAHSVLVVSQRQAMGGRHHGNEMMEDKLGTNLSRRHTWVA